MRESFLPAGAFCVTSSWCQMFLCDILPSHFVVMMDFSYNSRHGKINCVAVHENKPTITISEYDQEIPQSQTADNPMAPLGRATQPSRDTRKTNKAKQPALFSPSRGLK